MVIDWSKAPEGANGFVPSGGPGTPSIWYRRDGQKLEWKPAEAPGDWMPSVHARDNIIWREELAAPWSGAGLPPVGTLCEVKYHEMWQVCEIIAHFEQGAGPVAAFTIAYADGNKSLNAFTEVCFRPLRTPEQIAAEERRLAIEAITKVLQQERCAGDTDGSLSAEAIWEAGYRKTEGGAA